MRPPVRSEPAYHLKHAKIHIDGGSSRFHRRFGYQRFLRVAVDTKLERLAQASERDNKTQALVGALALRDKLKQFLQRPFLIATWKFHAMWASIIACMYMLILI